MIESISPPTTNVTMIEITRAISSDDAFDLFGIKVEGRHTALGDAVATAQLFMKLLNTVRHYV